MRESAKFFEKIIMKQGPARWILNEFSLRSREKEERELFRELLFQGFFFEIIRYWRSNVSHEQGEIIFFRFWRFNF